MSDDIKLKVSSLLNVVKNKLKNKCNTNKEDVENPNRFKTVVFIPEGQSLPIIVSPEGKKIDLNKVHQKYNKELDKLAREKDGYKDLYVQTFLERGMDNFNIDENGRRTGPNVPQSGKSDVYRNTNPRVCNLSTITIINASLENEFSVAQNEYDFELRDNPPDNHDYKIKGTLITLYDGFYSNDSRAIVQVKNFADTFEQKFEVLNY